MQQMRTLRLIGALRDGAVGLPPAARLMVWDFCRYQTYDALKPHLLPYLRSSDEFEVYIPGCGNSSTYFASGKPVGSTLTHVDQA